MKSIFFVAAVLVAIAEAAPADDAPVAILAYESNQQPDGSYYFSYQSADGSIRQETGSVKEALDEENQPQRIIAVSGYYGYYNDQGNYDTVSYSADENGFQAQGDSIPKVPARR